MDKLGVLVGEEKWTFFKEIYEDLSLHYKTTAFQAKHYNVPILYGRLNRWSFDRTIRLMLQRNDLCFFEWSSELLLRASRMPKSCPIVTRLHSFELFDWAPQISWPAVDRIILVSQAMQKKFLALFPDQAGKTVVIYNGVSLDKFSPMLQNGSNLRIGMLCNVLPIKRVYEMVFAFADVKKHVPQASLHIAGNVDEDKRYTSAIKHVVEKLGLQEAVVFDGFVVDTPSWLKSIDIFVSNSFWEGHQVALIEAMASGCFCLSHRWDGVEEVLPDANLYYSNDEVCEKILGYFDSTGQEKSQKCMEMRDIACEKFDITKTKNRILEVLQDVSASC